MPDESDNKSSSTNTLACTLNSSRVYPCGLTMEDIGDLKEHLEESRRWSWLAQTIKIWVTWISTVMVAIYIMWDQLEKFAVWLKH